MIKLFIWLTLVLASYIPQPIAAQALADDLQKPITTTEVFDGNEKGTATMYGSGESFITDLKVNVQFENHAPYEIKLEDGYSPFMDTFDFGADDKLLFCSSQTGGSGGYGNYRIYRLHTTSYKLLYDDKADSAKNTFAATFKPHGFMRLENNVAQTALDVYVGYMDDSFYNAIFAADGSVKGEQPYVNDISFVSPSLNPASGLYRLMTYRSVAAVAEVNRLGYIVQTLSFTDGEFVPAFTEFSISL